jgi:hypothetical protein
VLDTHSPLVCLSIAPLYGLRYSPASCRLPPSDIQDKPPTVQVGHYGRPTVTPEDQTNRFDTDIDADAWEEWDRILRFELPPLLPILSPLDIDSRVDTIYLAFNKACKATMKSVGAAPGFNSRWWNDECKAAANATKGGFWTEEEARQANRHLKKVVWEAKRDWANDYISTANIWEVVAWRHGRRSLLIPALLGNDGKLVYDHEEMVLLLSA